MKTEFLKKIRNKLVHVDFIDEKGTLSFIEGELDYELEVNEEAQEASIFVEIISGTDFVRIPDGKIRKIYVKE